MSTPASTGASPATRLGIQPGALVQSIGDDDVDSELLHDVVTVSGEELIPEDSDDIVDVVLLWWRDEEEDDVADALVDSLVDARRNLGDAGVVWLLTPKQGRPGHVASSDIQEAVPTAGMAVTSTVSAAPAWTGSRLVAPKSGRARR